MANAEKFIEHCEEIVADYQSGKLDLNAAAMKINVSPTQYPFDGNAHPMVYKIADLAFDIAEDYRSEKEDKADWKLLVETLTSYTEGNWEPTCWILNATFGNYEGDKLTHSYSVSVSRLNGTTLIETAMDEIKNAINKISNKLNTKQTDERYLKNLKVMIPQNIGSYKLHGVEVNEFLTEPYYTTAG